MSQIIIQNCNQCSLDLPLKYEQQLYKRFQIRHPNAFYLKRRVKDWDGKVKFITQRGNFKIGLLPAVMEACHELGINPKVVDLRKPVPIVSKPVTKVGKYELRPEQIKAVSSVINNKIGNCGFHIGVLDYTVNAGKCNGKGTLVHTSKGLLPIEQIVNEDGLITKDIKVLTKEGVYVKPQGGIFNQIKALKITTSQGYSLICGYDNHRLYTYKVGKLDWVYVKELNIGDNIPISLQPLKHEYTLDNDLCYWLGCISGDGHVHKQYKGSLNISISGEDYEIAHKIEPIWNSLCNTPIKIKPHRRFKGFYISKSDINVSKLLQEDFPELIGLANTKYVPNKILSSSPDNMAYYIAGLFDTDGHNAQTHGRRSLSFSTTSPENAKRVQIMLLTLGIPSCLKVKKTSYKDYRGVTYRIIIHSEYYDDFLDKIPLVIPRKRSGGRLKRNNYSHKLPFGLSVSKLYRGLELSKKKEFITNNPKILHTQITHPERLTLPALKALNKLTGGLEDLISFTEKVYWDKITKIEVLDSYPCYDMHIPGYENYITNGFISHNTLMMSALYYSFNRGLKTLLITQDSDWLQQAKTEFKEYLPGEEITFIQGGKVTHWANFSIGMVQSISRNIKVYQPELAKIDMVLVDEADQAGNKTYQNVLTHLYNTRVRIGLSGTIYMSKLAKDRLKNMNLEAYFGRKLAEFRLSESIKKGYSTKTIVKMIPAFPYYPFSWTCDKLDYKDIYDKTITQCEYAWDIVLDRLRFNIKYGRLPALVVCKFVNHCENLYKYISNSLEGNLNIARVHVNTPDKERKRIMADFRQGKIDILISTTIIARGKNFPLLKLLINAASMDSQEKSIQFLGRLVRTDKSKSKVYLDDIHYFGDYLLRHGNHRRIYYQKEKLKVIQLDKLWKKYTHHRHIL